VIQELLDYSKLPEDEVRYMAANSQEITAKKWAEADRSTPEGLRAFYSSVTNWVFGTLSYHARQTTQPHPILPVDAAVAVANRKPGEHLDFGAGVATASLLFARLGWRSTASDVAPPLLDFARWRFAKNGLDFRVIDLNSEKIPADTYDLITAFNTMAHVDNAAASLRDLHAALRPGGLLIFDIDSRKKSGTDQWFLYDSHNPILRIMRRTGFKPVGIDGILYIYERVERSPLRRQLVGAYDALRYNNTTTWIINKLRGLKRRLKLVTPH
jgi:SAM-dependent methyltransferase